MPSVITKMRNNKFPSFYNWDKKNDNGEYCKSIQGNAKSPAKQYVDGNGAAACVIKTALQSKDDDILHSSITCHEFFDSPNETNYSYDNIKNLIQNDSKKLGKFGAKLLLDLNVELVNKVAWLVHINGEFLFGKSNKLQCHFRIFDTVARLGGGYELPDGVKMTTEAVKLLLDYVGDKLCVFVFFYFFIKFFTNV